MRGTSSLFCCFLLKKTKRWEVRESLSKNPLGTVQKLRSVGVSRCVKVETLRQHYVMGEGGGIGRKHDEKHYVFPSFLFISKGILNRINFGFFLFNIYVVLSIELNVDITETVFFLPQSLIIWPTAISLTWRLNLVQKILTLLKLFIHHYCASTKLFVTQ